MKHWSSGVCGAEGDRILTMCGLDRHRNASVRDLGRVNAMREQRCMECWRLYLEFQARARRTDW